MRSFVALAAVATTLMAATGAVASAATSPSVSAATWRTAREIPPPVSSSTIYDVVPQAVSCWAVGDCVAGGYLQTAPPCGCGFSYQEFPIVAADSGGRWSSFGTLPLPSDVVTGNPTPQRVTSISCPAQGFCVAVGYYTGTLPGNTAVHGFIATDINGTWARTVTVPLPGGQAGASGLESVSCASRSYCVAVGSYVKCPAQQNPGCDAFPLPGGAPFSVTYSHATWRASGRPALKGSVTGDEVMSMAVSCRLAGDCYAVGTRYNVSPRTLTSFQWRESGGRWGNPTITSPPAAVDRSRDTQLVSVSCSAAKSCISVGFFIRHGLDTAMQVVLANGRWQRAIWIRYDSATLNAVDCTSTHCVAAGRYNALYGSLIMSEQRGKALGAPVRIHLPSNAIPNTDNEQINGLTAVSCLGKSWCEAVGYYTGPGTVTLAMATAN